MTDELTMNYNNDQYDNESVPDPDRLGIETPNLGPQQQAHESPDKESISDKEYELEIKLDEEFQNQSFNGN